MNRRRPRPTTGKQSSNPARVRALVRDVRRRWRRRALLQGGAWSLGAVAAAGLLLLALYRLAAPLWLLGAVLVLGVLAVGYVAFRALVRPLLRPLTDRQVAMLIEEHAPELEDRLNSAVEIAADERKSAETGLLVDRLLDDAARRAAGIPGTGVVDLRHARWLGYGAGALVLAFLVFGYASLDELGSAVPRFRAVAAAVSQPYLTVDPGNAEVEQGASQEILVRLREASDRPVQLHYRSGEGEWARVEMTAGLDEPVYLHVIDDIQAPVEYFVEHVDRRSEPFLLSLYTFPEVQRIDATYRYPAYTGRAPRLEEYAGDLRGLQGSTVDLRIEAAGAVEQGELVLGDGRTVELRVSGGAFTARLPLEEEGTYRVRLVDDRGKENRFPEEYLILPEPDEAPRISLTDPGRDVRANAVEEVLVAATVEDDYGVRAARLRYSVNGAPEETVSLAEASRADSTFLRGEHLLFLEEYDLEPGDVISYYVEADDGFAREMPATTDMYFVEVIPFDQRFSQAANMGGMQGGQASGPVLNQQQIIAATWKLYRERAEMEPARFRESLAALTQAQRALRDNIQERISGTAFSLELRLDEENRQVVEYLRAAVEAMDEALAVLGRADLREALTPERQALNQLLKADALNRDRQVASNRQPGAGGQGTEERMTELMDLELDISKDKYETQQQASERGSSPEAVDEALERVRDLARRQQNLVNQARREVESEEDRRREVERLRREQEELQRQAEELTASLRRQSQEDGRLSEDVRRQLDRASESMRRAGRSLQEGDPQDALARQQQALNELNRLQEDLQRAQGDDSRDALERIAREADRLRQEEAARGEALRRAAQDAEGQGAPDRQTLERLAGAREQAREDLERLREDVRQAEERLRRESPETRDAIRRLRQRIERDGLEEQMASAEQALRQGWMGRAEQLQEEIQEGADRIEKAARGLAGRLPETNEDQLAGALRDVRQLTEQLEGMREEMQQGAAAGQEGEASERARATRMRREMDRAREAIGRLQDQLSDNPAAGRALQRLSSVLSQADNTGIRLEGDAAKAYFDEQVFQPLSQLEAEIRQRLDELDVQRKLFGGRPGEVPASFREYVERYYERLSKGRNE